MACTDRRLLVLSLVIGDNFEDMPAASIVAEARLGPRILRTDPVKFVKRPVFSQELAWALDRKSLRLFRLYRRSIRLQFYTIHSKKCARCKDPLGYVVLDLREATRCKMFRWRMLLGKKCEGSPEVCCGLSIETDYHENA